MRVSLSWLRQYVDVDIAPHELAERLTMAGLAVEGMEVSGEEISGLVVGEITGLSDHPDSDKLKVAKVAVGGGRILSLVSGAPNQQEKVRVVAALPGATLPGGVTINEAEFKGQVSQGMLCSEEELGLAEHSEGILILPDDAPLGTDIVEYLGLKDVVFDIELTANRPDCHSMLGVAREVAAILGKEIHYPVIQFPEEEQDTKDVLRVEVMDETLCPRYMAKVVTDVKIGPSPLWLKKCLISAGMRPINNVVDITNFVLLEQNQPLHAFDFDKLQDHKLRIRRANTAERLITLDEVDRPLTQENLVIADEQGPVCIAGVMGGANSEVDENTKTIALESAWFEQVSIRRTSKTLGLRSEASARFERGVNPDNLPVALRRAVQLMVELCGAKALRGEIDIYPNPESRVRVSVTTERVNTLLGTNLKEPEIRSVLDRLPGFELTETGSGEWSVLIPTYRRDISVSADLVEEVARLVGYDTIPVTLPASPEVVGLLSASQAKVEKVKAALVGAGLSEIITYSMTNEAAYSRLGMDTRLARKVDLVVPLSEEHRFMRTSMLPSILNTLSFNYNRGHRDLGLFEIGRTYLAQDNDIPIQDTHLGVGAMGNAVPASWFGSARSYDFFDLKGWFELVLTELGISGAEFVPTEEKNPFHPGRNAEIWWDGRNLGALGELHPKYSREFGFSVPVLLAELNLQPLLETQTAPIAFKRLPKFPASRKDIAVIVPVEIPAADIEGKIRALGGEYLEELALFDRYVGPQITEGKKSLAYSLLLRHPGRTLTDDEISQLVNRVAGGLQSSFKAEFRS